MWGTLFDWVGGHLGETLFVIFCLNVLELGLMLSVYLFARTWGLQSREWNRQSREFVTIAKAYMAEQKRSAREVVRDLGSELSRKIDEKSAEAADKVKEAADVVLRTTRGAVAEGGPAGSGSFGKTQ